MRVLKPAGMRSSMVRLPTADKIPGGAQPYTAGPEPEGVMTPEPAPLELGSSGLITTAEDLAKWVRALADGDYPELFESSDPLGSIDAGTDKNGEYVSVQGTLPGYVANAIAWRDRNLTISFTGNLFSYPALTLGGQMRALAGENPPAPPLPRPAAVPLTGDHRALEGTYDHPNFGSIQIVHDGKERGMMLTLPGKPPYWSFYLTPLANAQLHWRAFDQIFVRDADGALKAIERRPNKDDQVIELKAAPRTMLDE